MTEIPIPEITGDKVRLRFAKTGGLRLLGHQDLMRCHERMLRRGGVPFASTAGFHPMPRLVFALSLPLGVVGRNEVVELELTRPEDPAAILAALAAQAPAGLHYHSARVIGKKQVAMPRRMAYRLALPPDRVAAARAAAAALMANEKVWEDRMLPKPRRVNIRRYLRALTVTDDALTADLWVTPTGTARADELLKMLGLSDLPDEGFELARTELDLHDETPAGSADGPPDGPAETALMIHPPAGTPADRPSTPAGWGGLPAGPVVE